MTQEELLQRIGTRIRQARKERGLTQAELAAPEYTKSFISQVEKGRLWPSLQAMIHIARRLDKPLDWFVADEPPPTPLERLARELDVDPEKLRAALERALFGR